MKTFEDAFMDIQSELISICLELTDQADQIYAYVSNEETSAAFNAFYVVDGKTLSGDEIEPWKGAFRQVLDLAMEHVIEIDEVCAEYEMPAPREMKMVYRVKTGAYDAQFAYEPVCTPDNDLTPTSVFMDWQKEVQEALNKEEKTDE